MKKQQVQHSAIASKSVNGIKFIITLKSFHADFIRKGRNKITKQISDWKLPIVIQSCVGQPKKRKRFTLLKSPHVDKKSRSQYEINKAKSRIELYFYKQPVFLSEFFFFWIQNSKFPGIQLTITRKELGCFPAMGIVL